MSSGSKSPTGIGFCKCGPPSGYASKNAVIEGLVAIIVFTNRYRISVGRVRDIVADTFLPKQ